ncbi:MAG: hypothetical protein Q4D74_05715 [Comamonadaceae bacterium]|nr:hypothetical protein [Comamonadaceae bacterium]RRD58898.1 hypothetical protein EII20_00055 [Comamonadaceae bacterium OH2545_COT-014]
MRIGSIILVVFVAQCLYIAMAVLRAALTGRMDEPDMAETARHFRRKAVRASVAAALTLGLYALLKG